ncbi:MAG: quinol:cytochrome C oxidoreductase, partial [Ignavibacteriaceae bacterium]|nr:quinol:cytochrome C oxidoreductase [Ignavibacteriaceae bacterium]
MATKDLTYVKKELPGKILNIGIALLAIGLIVGAFGLLLDPTRAKFSYLLGFFYLLTIGMGALFLISLEYVVNADWSTPIRRIPEFISASVPLFIVVAIPLFFFIHDLYHWSHTDAVATDAL